MAITSNKISLRVHNLLRYISVIREVSLKGTIEIAIVHYREVHEKIGLNTKNKIQNPLIYPVPLKSVALAPDDRLFINHLVVVQEGGAVEALDRVIITYQNDYADLNVPDSLRVNWLDDKYLTWQDNVPE